VRIAHDIASFRPAPCVALSGGEPLLTDGLLDVLRVLNSNQVPIALYTSGFRVSPGVAERLADLVDFVAVSLDAADADICRRLRGRSDALERALETLEILDSVAAGRRRCALRTYVLTIETLIMRTNFSHVEAIASVIAPRYPNVTSLHFSPVYPAGFASDDDFIASESLTSTQLAMIERLEDRLHVSAPRGVRIEPPRGTLRAYLTQLPVTRLHDVCLKIQADGRVRAHSFFACTVGSAVDEQLRSLWQRARAHPLNKVASRHLANARSARAWAMKCREIETLFASDLDKRTTS
jgi:pyruvate-formate lyase-activating enzyme